LKLSDDFCCLKCREITDAAATSSVKVSVAPMIARPTSRHRLLQGQTLSIPSICATPKDCNLSQTGSKQFRGCLGRTPIGLADHHDRPPQIGEFLGSLGQIGKRHVDGSGQVARRSGKFLRLAHVDDGDGSAGNEAAL
jgi:hypothetical protein